MKRIAVPILNDRLSELFGECEHYEIYEVDRKIVGRIRATLPEGIQITDLPVWLHDLGVTDVFTYRINPLIIRLFASLKVNLFVGVPTGSPESLIDAYLQGRLESDEHIIEELTTTK